VQPIANLAQLGQGQLLNLVLQLLHSAHDTHNIRVEAKKSTSPAYSLFRKLAEDATGFFEAVL
jgi:hypothetical protein